MHGPVCGVFESLGKTKVRRIFGDVLGGWMASWGVAIRRVCQSFEIVGQAAIGAAVGSGRAHEEGGKMSEGVRSGAPENEAGQRGLRTRGTK